MPAFPRAILLGADNLSRLSWLLQHSTANTNWNYLPVHVGCFLKLPTCPQNCVWDCHPVALFGWSLTLTATSRQMLFETTWTLLGNYQPDYYRQRPPSDATKLLFGITRHLLLDVWLMCYDTTCLSFISLSRRWKRLILWSWDSYIAVRRREFGSCWTSACFAAFILSAHIFSRTIRTVNNRLWSVFFYFGKLGYTTPRVQPSWICKHESADHIGMYNTMLGTDKNRKVKWVWACGESHIIFKLANHAHLNVADLFSQITHEYKIF